MRESEGGEKHTILHKTARACATGEKGDKIVPSQEGIRKKLLGLLSHLRDDHDRTSGKK